MKMKVSRIISVIVSVIFMHGKVVDAKGQCNDSTDFFLAKKPKRTCAWIRETEKRRIKYCKSTKVLNDCPFTCGVCCENDKSYILDTPSGDKKCWWVGRKQKRKDKWCDKINNGILVSLACPDACDFCQETIPPTSSPPPTPEVTEPCVNDPNFKYQGNERGCIWLMRQEDRETICLDDLVSKSCRVSCGECCADNPDYHFKIAGKKRKCDWLSKQNQETKDEYCPRWLNKITVENACLKTCDRCFTDSPTSSTTNAPTVRPTKSPTGIPTGSPTKAPSTSPTKGPTGNPTQSPTNIPSKAPTSNPTKGPTTSPTGSPTKFPTTRPTGSPTASPTKAPSTSPTKGPTDSPTGSPSKSPTTGPTKGPTGNPTQSPTNAPTVSSTSCDWSQIGNDIAGGAGSDRAGPVALSSDGLFMAVGSYKNDDTGNNAGQVRVYEFSSSSWSQRGSDINGEVSKDEAGTSVGLSSNGEIVAIGSPKNDDGKDGGGQVRVYEWDGSTSVWGQKGSDIQNEKKDRAFGTSVALTSNGLTLVAGGPGVAGKGKKGMVEVYVFINGSWSIVHGTINGDTSDEAFGASVAITAIGSTIAVGNPGSPNGSVVVYANNGIQWSPSSSLVGDSSGDLFGTSVAITSFSSKYLLAVGAPGRSSEKGRVVVYDSADAETFSVLATFNGDTAGDEAGKAVDLSQPDGSVLAIGYPGNGSGYVRIFKDDGASWNQINDDIGGASSGDEFGAHVSVSNSFEIAIGAERNDSSRGLVQVYDNTCI